MSYRKVLVSPSGKEVVSYSPRDTNDLKFAHGYTEKPERKPKSKPETKPQPKSDPNPEQKSTVPVASENTDFNKSE